MQATATWQNGLQSKISNDRGQEVTIDLPLEENGGNAGPTAFELVLMSLAGCVSTIFTIIARNSKLTFSALQVECDGELNAAEKEFVQIKVLVKVSSEAEQKLLERILNRTIATCPVGIIFEKAKIPIRSELVKS